jgi:hypothetical protein
VKKNTTNMNYELTGVAERANHEELLHALLACSSPGATGRKRRIGVYNESGAVYWRIATVGEREFAKVMAVAKRLGFRNELEAFSKPVGGYDALLVEVTEKAEA